MVKVQRTSWQGQGRIWRQTVTTCDCRHFLLSENAVSVFYVAYAAVVCLPTPVGALPTLLHISSFYGNVLLWEKAAVSGAWSVV